MASTALKLLRASPTAFTKYLQKDLGLNGFHMVSRGSGLVASTPELQEVADYLTSQGGDYEGHEAIFARIGPTSQVLQVCLFNVQNSSREIGCFCSSNLSWP